MSELIDSEADQRFLLLAPTGRDAPLTSALLARGGLTCVVCKDMEELCTRLEQEGAACLLIAEESLVKRAFARLCGALAQQESWSDVPILLFTASTSSFRPREPNTKALTPLGNVTLLERPVRPITMLSAAKAALRVRRRQYVARSELFAQQRAVRLRDQFLAMLGHELRNPLAAIALANTLRADRAPDRSRDVIDRQVHHLTRLVDDLLDVARVTSDKIVLHREHLDLTQLARACLSSFGSSPATSPTLRFEAPATPVIVHGDPVRLEQVIVNLLTNATKYTPPGGSVVVSVFVEGDVAILEVQDNGVGIAAEMLDHVFDLFTQVEGSLDRAQGGLGIGLTLVRRVVELHEGRVEAFSQGLGRGSTFRMLIPLATLPTAALTLQSTSESAVSDQHYEVLIVEDNADSRELLAEVIERLGHHVLTAEDGPSGVQQALTRRPDVLLVDIGLPGLDGYAVARRVRARLGSGIYLIALTGYGQPEDRRRALDAGFDAHFTKPLDVQAIDHLLRRSDLSAARPAEAVAGE